MPEECRGGGESWLERKQKRCQLVDENQRKQVSKVKYPKDIGAGPPSQPQWGAET